MLNAEVPELCSGRIQHSHFTLLLEVAVRDLIQTTNVVAARPVQAAVALPADAGGVRIREATMADLPFIDRLQKASSQSLGFLKRQALEQKLEAGDVVVAEEFDRHEGTQARRHEVPEAVSAPSCLRASVPSCLPRRVGYCIASDRYYKREDVGVVFQVNVEPGRQRGLVGAALVRAVFARWPYGVRLASCWCAQDLVGPSLFWQSLGFVPLAYRGGSRKKSRVHIFWQCQVRAEQDGGGEADWWYPSQTTGGMLCEDRLVLPIPPGVHWSEVKRVLLPGKTPAALPKPKPRKREAKPKTPAISTNHIASGGFRFESAVEEPKVEEKPVAQKERPTRPKNDPVLIREVRELRDHYLEQVNRDGLLLAAGKYTIARALPCRADGCVEPLQIGPSAGGELPRLAA